MSEVGVAFELVGGRLQGPAGPLPAGASVTLRATDGGLTLLGGDPPTAWQIPYAALREPRCRAHRESLEIAGWVAGSLLMVTFPATADGVTATEVDAHLAAASGRREPARSTARPRRPRRRRWILLAVAIVAIGSASWLLAASAITDHARRSAAADRAAAAAMNLRATDLPAGWSADHLSTSPLGGFLQTGGSGPQTPAQKRVSSIVISAYQHCIGIPDAKDRVFGAAGVTPPVEVGGLPYARTESTAVTEVGTVTQRYASPADVAADRVQISSPRFPTCFGEALGRLATAGGEPTKARADLPTTRQVLRQPLGVTVTGADVTIPVASLTGSATAQLGVTVLVSGNFEQTLYTLTTPGTFPASLRQQLVGELSARLAGVSGARSA